MNNETTRLSGAPDWAIRKIRFRKDMKKAGLEVQEYKGRYFYEGPAVVVKDLQDAIRVTDIPLQWDHMGLQWVIYPRRA